MTLLSACDTYSPVVTWACSRRALFFLLAGVALQLWSCNGSPSQNFVFRASSGTLFHPRSALCVEPVRQIETGDPTAGPIQLAVCDGKQKQVSVFASLQLQLCYHQSLNCAVAGVGKRESTQCDDVALRCNVPQLRDS